MHLSVLPTNPTRSVQTIFYRPKEKQALADQKKAKFHMPEGDHVTLLNVFNSWKNNKFSNPWCYENFVQARNLRRAADVRKQLLGIMDRHKLDVVSCGKNFKRVQQVHAWHTTSQYHINIIAQSSCCVHSVGVHVAVVVGSRSDVLSICICILTMSSLRHLKFHSKSSDLENTPLTVKIDETSTVLIDVDFLWVGSVVYI